ncbi:PTS ascorbate transporter subunit IIC [Peptoniphilaceae bacterium SGI.137]|nr:PTS ascorbate transporter subunit IIC [Peptoniphilaceae bacterium]MDY3987577.1 PTS ascorbate transporter subunit IIC [Peptoniphilaceae bacterium]MDY5842049.1 PTS ascorbate transporter subunit IIC [Peptoniphilaceae bacterium]
MEVLNSIWTVIFNNVISRPAIFIGLIVAVGYILLRKKWYEIIGGFIKAAVGYMILQVGAKNLFGAVNPLIQAIEAKWNISAVVIDPNFGFTAAEAALASIGETLSMAMITLLVAFLWNVFLVAFRKVTKVRTLFTTGHIMVKQAAVATWIVFLLVPSLRNIWGILITGMLCGTYWAVGSNLTVKATNDLTENAGFAVGHQQMFGIWFVDRFAGKIGNKEKGVDGFHLSGPFKLLDDYTVSTTVIMGLFFGAIIFIIGEPVLRNVDGAFAENISFPLYIFEKAASFAVNLTILKTGVRMFVNELVQSFEGISGSVLKGSVPAVDCAATFGFGSSNAITLGFIFGGIGQLIGIALLIITKNPIMIIPGFVPLFYDNATLGLYANNKGGLRAVIVFCMASGLLQVLGSAAAIILFQMAPFGGYVGNLDWATAWPVIGFIIKNLHIVGIGVAIIGLLLIPQLQYRKEKETYFEL